MADQAQRKFKREQSKKLKTQLAQFKIEEQKLAEKQNLTQCAICLEFVSHGARCLPCGHVFHDACVRRILDNRCPNCRLEIRKPRARPLPPQPAPQPAPQPIFVQGVLNPSDQVPHLFRCTHSMIFSLAQQCEVAHLTRDILTHAITHNTSTSFDATIKLIQDFMLKSINKCGLISGLTYQNWLGELASQRLRDEEERGH